MCTMLSFVLIYVWVPWKRFFRQTSRYHLSRYYHLISYHVKLYCRKCTENSFSRKRLSYYRWETWYYASIVVNHCVSKIDEIINVTTSRQQQKNANEKQLQAGNQSIEIINQEEAENQSNESVGNVGRVNKLLLTDGHQQVSESEWYLFLLILFVWKVVGIDLGEVLYRHVSRGGHNKNVSAGSKVRQTKHFSTSLWSPSSLDRCEECIY